jgi:hypothetical protein
MALQKQPPVSVKGVEGRDAIAGFEVTEWGSWHLICWGKQNQPGELYSVLCMNASHSLLILLIVESCRVAETQDQGILWGIYTAN